jgi:Lrp/AsnC family leucine-responsive transcriptional regulator
MAHISLAWRQDVAFRVECARIAGRRNMEISKDIAPDQTSAHDPPNMSDLDATDRRLLTLLQRDGRITNADLADRVNLSASACHRRVQRLEEAGFITGYVALVDPRRVFRKTTVFVEITLSGQADELLEAFEREVARIPDVLECHLMTGSFDYLLKVVAEDTEDFARIHRRFLACLPGVAQMRSSFALRTVRQTTALPV